MAERWFTPSETQWAIVIGNVANNLGWAFGYVWSPLYMKNYTPQVRLQKHAQVFNSLTGRFPQNASYPGNCRDRPNNYLGYLYERKTSNGSKFCSGIITSEILWRNLVKFMKKHRSAFSMMETLRGLSKNKRYLLNVVTFSFSTTID